MRCDLNGGSGETGCLQFLESTWKMWSKEHIGYVAPQSKINEMYVATLQVQKWIDNGYTDKQVFLSWNAGRPHEVKGINKHGIAYDSGLYALKALAYYND